MISIKQKSLLILCLILLEISCTCFKVFAQETTKEPIDLMAPLKLSIAKTENYFVSLEDVLKLAIENNIPLQITKEQEKIDKLDVYTKISALLPDVIPSYDQSRFQGGFQIFGNQTFLFARTSITPRLTVNYKLFSGGESVYNILAAKRTHKATEYSIINSANNLLKDTTNTYYELLKANKILEIAKKEVEESEALLELNQSRLDVGLGTILEVSQSESQLAESKRKYIDANKNILKITQHLNRILNLPIELNLIPSDTEILKHTLINETEMSTLLDLAVENRADLQEIKQLKKVYMAQRGVARSKFFPTLDLQVYWGGQGPRFSDIEEQRQIGYGVRLDFLKNLGMNYVSNYKKSKPLLKQVDLRIEQKWRDIETEIADALLEAETSERQIEVAKTGLKAAEDSFSYATERLKAGVGTNIDVLSAQTRLTTSRTNLLSSVIDYNKSQINMMNSIGIITIDKILGNEPVIPVKQTDITQETDKETTLEEK
ncbi:MAG: TolC family protein [Cyanobacteriota bacterium]